jgi:hypothetical protein
MMNAKKMVTSVSPNDAIQFTLRLDRIEIGKLTYYPWNARWSFKYSDQFKSVKHLRPLLEFPDLNREYVSPELWSFFSLRIPSMERFEIADVLKKNHVSPDDKPSLLKLFGRLSAANPFELVPA